MRCGPATTTHAVPLYGNRSQICSLATSSWSLCAVAANTESCCSLRVSAVNTAPTQKSRNCNPDCVVADAAAFAPLISTSPVANRAAQFSRVAMSEG